MQASLRWIADECISAKIVAQIRAEGHDVLYVLEQSPSSKDRSVLDLAIREQRLLLTDDKDFGELIFARPAASTTGVILMRIPDERAHMAWPRLKILVEHFGSMLMERYVVVEEARFRVRLVNLKQ